MVLFNLFHRRNSVWKNFISGWIIPLRNIICPANWYKAGLLKPTAGEQADFQHQYQMAVPIGWATLIRSARAWRVIPWMKMAWRKPEESITSDCVLLLTCVHLNLCWLMSYRCAEPALPCQALNLKLLNSRSVPKPVCLCKKHFT